jgi:hypothetical protein
LTIRRVELEANEPPDGCCFLSNSAHSHLLENPNRRRVLGQRTPGCDLPDSACAQLYAGGGGELALEMAQRLADLPMVDALHVMALGDEPAAAQVAAFVRYARQVAPGDGVAGS